MRSLLFGLFVGYFFVACAPLHWSGARLSAAAGVLVLVVIALWVTESDRKSQPLSRWLSSLCCLVIGLLLATLALGLAITAVVSDAGAIAKSSSCTDARLMMRVQIEGLPRKHAVGSRFDARVLDVDPGVLDCQKLRGTKLRLGFRGPVTLLPDQKLLAEFQLREVRGSVSPGAFDHELHSILQGVVLGGYVSQAFSLRDSSGWSMDAKRFAVRQYLNQLDLEHTGVILALATGDNAELAVQDWDLLQSSGTVHLMVISGLHVGLVAALLFVLLRPIAGISARLLPGSRSSALHLAVLTLGILLMYVHWVGASVPALRAWLMAAVALMGWALERSVQAPTLLLIAAVGVIGMAPLAGLTAGFWLSFALVAWLLCLPDQSSRNRNKGPQTQARLWPENFVGKLRQIMILHIGATLLLLPLLAWLGLPIAPVGPLANFLAVPFVTIVLVPWVLLSVVSLSLAPQLAANLFVIADAMVAVLFHTLRLAADVWPATSVSVPELDVVLSASVVVVVLLMPVSAVVRGVAGSALLIWWLQNGHSPQPELPTPDLHKPEQGEFNLQILDVGQGLAVIVGTAEAVVLYDTGASFPSGFNYADSVIIPALRRRHVQQLDALVVSHGDNDHAGGAARILERFKPSRLAGSISPADTCQWYFGGLTTNRILSAGVELQLIDFAEGKTANDRSCVLLIRGAHTQAVLAGDIEVSAERALLAQLPNGVDVLTVAHHGSLTSSSEEFVHKLQPGLALVSAGYKNRFGHPHADVVKRYEAVGTQVLNTANAGTLSWSSADVASITSARRQRLHRWRLGAPLVVTVAEGRAANP